MEASESHSGPATPFTRELQLRRAVLLLLFFYVFLTYLCAYRPLVDPDLWWHLATGRWILENGALPSDDPFSQYGEGRPWVAYSWLFEVAVFGIWERFGMVGVLTFRLVLMLLIAGLLWDLLRRLSRRVFVALLLTALTLYVLLPLNTTRPWLVTVLLIVVQLHLLVRFREKPRLWLLAAMPPLFVLWANVHVQFLYGLLLLGAFWADRVWQALQADSEPGRQEAARAARQLTVAGLACGVAALVNPYGWGVYRVILVYLGQTELNFHISESGPLQFRHFWDWIVLAMALGGIFVLGWRRSREPLPYLLLLFGVLQTFRMQRDVWWLALMAALVLAGFPDRRLDASPVIGNRWLAAIVVVVIAACLFVVPPRWEVTQESVDAEIDRLYPARAARAIREAGWAGPLYNDYNWGGYLIWALPEYKVSLDGRTPVHGAERILRINSTWGGKASWDEDEELQRAGIVIGHYDLPLVSLLRLDSRFEVGYEDDVAVVFVPASSVSVSE